MPKSIYYSYKNLRVIQPEWSRARIVYYTYLSLKSFVKQRYDSFLLLKYKKFKYKPHIINKKYLDSAIKKGGIVFVSIHADSYTLAGEIYKNFYKTRNLVVPYYHHNKISAYKYFKKKFARHGIEIIKLGGAMESVKTVLSKGGSIVLFLDAEIPVKHTSKVKMFGKEINLSTGPLWLAEKYNLTILPFCVTRKEKDIYLQVFKPIEYKNKSKEKVMQDIAKALEKMILMNLRRWHVFDKFLLN